MPYKPYTTTDIRTYSNKMKPEPEYVRMRNLTAGEIVLRRTSKFFGFQEVRFEPGGEADVETGMFAGYQCQSLICAGRLDLVENTPPDLPTAA